MASRQNTTVTLRHFKAVLSALFVMCACVQAEIRSAVIDKQTGKLSVVEGYREGFVAWSNFTDDINTSG